MTIIKSITAVVIAYLLFNTTLLAQSVGINTTTPDPSSVMDISSFDKGLLIPRVALSAANLANPITAPTVSLLVYNTAYNGASPNEVIPGYYYWDGVQWVSLKGNAWQLSGNAGTTAGTNFIGTTDAQDMVVKTNNTEKLRVLTTGELGIGTNLPTATLDVNGTTRLRNVPLITAAENTLTIDATGNVHQKAGVTYVGTVYGGDFGNPPNPPPVTGYLTSATATSFGCIWLVGCYKDEVQVNFPNLGTTNYVVTITAVCETGGQSCGDSNVTIPIIYDRTSSSFKFIQSGTILATQDITWHLMLTTY
jgi:hypothetical protein